MRRTSLLALLCVYTAIVAAAVVSRVVFERLPHLEDEFAYLFQARIFQNGEVAIDTPQPSSAYWQPFLINLNGQRFSKYPPAWSLVLAIGTGLNLPWVVNAWLAGLNVALTYRLGRELFDPRSALVGALLLTFSPIALLLNATLMSHTLALTCTLLFTYGLWRVEKDPRRAGRWAGLAGLSLGFLLATRPLAAVGVSAPFILYGGGRVLWGLRGGLPRAWPILRPLLLLSLASLPTAGLYPLYNWAVADDPTANLYTMVWPYDKVGFGEGHGRYGGEEFLSLTRDGQKISLWTHAGHSPRRGWNILRKDSKCYSRDLFGWVPQPDNPPDSFHGNDCLVDRAGYSWVLLPLTLLYGLWRVRGTGGGIGRKLGAFFVVNRWAFLLGLCAASVILVQMSYWIGAGVYSARYYFEATAALALLSGAGAVGLASILRRWGAGIYALVGIAVLFATVSYTPERLRPLQGYGRISREPLAIVESLRYTPETPVLVIIAGEQHWRVAGPFMAVTDPYATAPIIGLRDTRNTYAVELIEKYPERQVIFLRETGFEPLHIAGRAGYSPSD